MVLWLFNCKTSMKQTLYTRSKMKETNITTVIEMQAQVTVII